MSYLQGRYHIDCPNFAGCPGWIQFSVPIYRSTCVFSKQWLLAGEFSEFEYSRETCRFWRVRVLAKTAVFGNVSDSPDLPAFAKPCRADSPDSPTFAEPCRADSSDSPTFAELCCADSPDSRKASLARFMRI